MIFHGIIASSFLAFFIVALIVIIVIASVLIALNIMKERKM